MDGMKDLVREIAEKSVEKHREIFKKMHKCRGAILHKIDNKSVEMRSVHRTIQLISHPDNKDIYDSTQIDLSYSFIRDGKLDKANLKGANLQGIYWDGLSKYCVGKNIDLTAANLNEAYLVKLEREIPKHPVRGGERQFQGSYSTITQGAGKLESIQLEHAYLLSVDLFEGDLRNANLSFACVLYPCLGSANLESANLTGAYFAGKATKAWAGMGTQWRYADFRRAIFKEITWSDPPDLYGAIVDVEHKQMLQEIKGFEDIIWNEGGKGVYRGQTYGSIEEAQNALRLNRQSGA